jgi:hypothetical protein
MFTKQLKLLIIFTYVIFAYQALAEAPFKLDVAGFAGNNRNFVQVGAFLPIIQNEDGLLFSDIRSMKHLSHFKKKNKNIYSEDTYEFNFGLGYRRILHQDLVFGGAAYYDIRKAQLKNVHFSQATLNFHILSQTWQSNLNLYAPIGKNKITKSSHVFTNKAKIVNNDVFFKYQDQSITEKAMKGIDFRVSTIMPNIDSIRLGTVAYYFQGNKSFVGGGPEINFAFNDSINIESSITYDKLRKANFILGIRFTFPSSKINKARPIDKLLSTKVARDIDLVTSTKTTNFLTQERQDNAIALNRKQLTGINDPSKLNENKELVSKLLLVVDNDGQIILSDDGENITLNDTNKFEAKSLAKSIAAAKSIANVKLDNNASAKQLVDDAINLSQETIEQIINLVAAEQVIQEQFGFNTIFISNQSVTVASNQKFLDSLIKKFSTSGNNSSQSYYINLPGYGNVEVKRAGTILIVNQSGKNYVVIGVDENNAIKHGKSTKTPYSTWFTGGLESRDSCVYEGLMRETFEESAGTVYITKAEFDYAIRNNQFIYDKQAKTLAIVKHDNSNNIDINVLNTKLAQVKRDKSISGSFKEMQEYTLVHPGRLKHMHDVIYMNQRQNGGNITKNPHDNIYKVSDYNNKLVRILKEYADSFYIGNGLNALYNTIGSFPSD